MQDDVESAQDDEAITSGNVFAFFVQINNFTLFFFIYFSDVCFTPFGSVQVDDDDKEEEH